MFNAQFLKNLITKLINKKNWSGIFGLPGNHQNIEVCLGSCFKDYGIDDALQPGVHKNISKIKAKIVNEIVMGEKTIR